MTVLRYRYLPPSLLNSAITTLFFPIRYGDPRNKIPHMFGMSLYQQKYLEVSSWWSSMVQPTHVILFIRVSSSYDAVSFSNSLQLKSRLLSRAVVKLPWLLGSPSFSIVIKGRHRSWRLFKPLVQILEEAFLLNWSFYEDMQCCTLITTIVSLSTNHLEVGSHVKTRSKARQDLSLFIAHATPQRNAKNVTFWTCLVAPSPR